MKRLGAYNTLGKVQTLGKVVSLGRGVVYAEDKARVALYKQILAKMPTTLKESLVAWYSPNLQGLTNAELYATDKIYSNGLRDLSGNNNHMTLYGFGGVEGEGHVDGDGNLVFDGNDDYSASTKAIIGQEFTLIADADVDKSKNFVMASTSLVNGNNGVQFNVRLNNNYYDNYGNNTSYLRPTYADVVSGFGYWTQYGRNTNNGNRYDYTDSEYMMIGNLRPNASYYCKMVFKSFVIFNRALSDTEIEWVKTNMLVSQEVTKHKVTLWHEGTKLATLNVQNGNTIDTDSLHYEFGNQCSCYWYTDVDCSELYYEQAVTEDMNLYCDSQMLYEYMLEQLDEVVLSDGTSAKDHLVCMYSPSLQGATKESILAEPKLEDLSGNEHNLTLYGFTEDEEIIGSDGSLKFDGVDDYADSDDDVISNTTNDFTILTDIYRVTKTPVGITSATIDVSAYMVGYAINSNNSFYGLYGGNNGRIWCKGSNSTILAVPTTKRDIVYTPTQITYDGGSVQVTSGSNNRETLKLRIAKNDVYIDDVIGYFVQFDQTLSSDILEQVKTILKLQ